MKQRSLLHWMLFALIAFTFSACDNEPLEGEFVVEGTGGTLEDTQFTATVNGEAFTAVTGSADVVNGTLSLVGVDANNNAINLVIQNPGICSFDLLGTTRIGQYVPLGDAANPFLTVNIQGVQVGSGTMTITELDLTTNSISGTFTISAERDIDDGTGTIITETVDISNGVFNGITLTIQEGDI